MKKSLVVLIHCLYWVPTASQSYIYLTVIPVSRDNSFALFSIGVNITEFIAFYLFYFILFTYLSKRKFPSFILYGLASILLAMLIGGLFAEIGNNIYKLSPFKGKEQYLNVYIYSFLLKALYSGVAGCFVKGGLTWYAEIRYKKELEKKNLETELALLKAQLNPHFLFNTLNNIDILIEKDPLKASIYLKKLSDMIRFMLYESPSETIPLSLEIKYIEQYIELQSVRTLTTDFIKFHTNGETSDLQIAPMLFIPFIENAFKHTTNKKTSHAVEIEILVNDRRVSFNCSNIAEQSVPLPQKQSGLGLELIRNRLELLYKGKYELEIDQSKAKFSVTLNLNLNEN